MRVNERVPCAGTIEALYLSVLDFEYMTLKRIKFCVWFQKKKMFPSVINFYLSVITDIYPL